MKTINIFLGTIQGVKNFVNTVSKLECDVDIVSGRYVIDAKSIMGIFSINLSEPVMVRIHADGEAAEEAAELLRPFQVK
ncbi:MAG: HPr family phosphocarrier protein [Eubacteriales bacterium]|nr:HPr family phosphocarrier protein [Eubacteriales bacterium]